MRRRVQVVYKTPSVEQGTEETRKASKKRCTLAVERWDIARPQDSFPDRLEQAARVLGLQVQRHALKSLPPNIHWHLKKPGMVGVLEVTFLTETKEAWLSVHSNRQASWIEGAVKDLLDAL